MTAWLRAAWRQAVAEDDKARIGAWMAAGEVNLLQAAQAEDWLARDPSSPSSYGARATQDEVFPMNAAAMIPFDDDDASDDILSSF